MVEQPKVLVVDDDENILSSFESFFNKEHCNLIPASCIDEAVINLLMQRIDLLIIDVNQNIQPGVTQFSYFRNLQMNLPIIIMTSYPDIISEKDAKNFGADYYFVKPLDLNKLRHAVQKCLQIRKVS